MNDQFYPGERPGVDTWIPSVPYFEHDPYTKATPEDFIKSELWWKGKDRDLEKYDREILGKS